MILATVCTTHSGWPTRVPCCHGCVTCQDTSTGETKGATVADDPSAAPAAATEVSEKVRMRNGMEWSNLVLFVVKLCPKNRGTPLRTLVPVEHRHHRPGFNCWKARVCSEVEQRWWVVPCHVPTLLSQKILTPINTHQYHLISIIYIYYIRWIVFFGTIGDQFCRSIDAYSIWPFGPALPQLFPRRPRKNWLRLCRSSAPVGKRRWKPIETRWGKWQPFGTLGWLEPKKDGMGRTNWLVVHSLFPGIFYS